MHILLIHQAFAALDEAGGTRHFELARYLVQNGHRVTIITSPVSYITGKSRSAKQRWVEVQTPQPGITILRSYAYPAIHRSFFHRVISFLSFMVSSFLVGLGVRKVDLVWGTSPPILQGVSAWLLARLKGVPFLFEVRDLWPAFAIAVGVLKNLLLIRASLWLEKFLYRQADRVMVNSPGFIDHVSARGARRVELIPNGADPAMFNFTGSCQPFRHNFGLDGKFVALYAGAHGISNNLETVLEAASRLHDQPEICFVLVGDGKEKANLQAKASRMNLSNVIFLPPFPKAEMPAVLAAADAGIAILMPLDLYKTTFPNKVFDYMAAARPVILAIDGVIRNVVEDARAGIAVQPGDPDSLAAAVKRLAASRSQAEEMGLAGRQYVEQHFNRSQLAEKLTLLLESMRK